MAMKSQLVLSTTIVLTSSVKKCEKQSVEGRNTVIQYVFALTLHVGTSINRLFET